MSLMGRIRSLNVGYADMGVTALGRVPCGPRRQRSLAEASTGLLEPKGRLD